VNNYLTSKQKLILFFIKMEFATDQYRLTRLFDTADFPVELGISLRPLLENQLIKVSGYLDNGNEFKYSITEKGIKYIELYQSDSELIEYIGSTQNPKLILECTQNLLRRKNGL